MAENTGAWWSYMTLQLIPSIQPLTGTRGRSLCTYVPRHGTLSYSGSGVAWIAKCRTVGGIMPTQVSHG